MRRATTSCSKASFLRSRFTIFNRALHKRKAILSSDIQSQLGTINQLTSDISDLNVKIANATTQGVEASSLEDQRDLKIDALSRPRQDQCFRCCGWLSDGLGRRDGRRIEGRCGSSHLFDNRESDTNFCRFIRSAHSNNFRAIGRRSRELQYDNSGLYVQTRRCSQCTHYPSKYAPCRRLSGSTIRLQRESIFSPARRQAISMSMLLSSMIRTKLPLLQTGRRETIRRRLAMANLQNQSVMNGGTATIPQYYNSFVSFHRFCGRCGAKYFRPINNWSINQLQSQRSSFSGVSIDEEMTNLTQYQQAYQASSEVVTVVNEMMQSLITMVQ